MADTANGHALPPTEDEPPRMLNQLEFIQEVQRRPAIWRAGGGGGMGKHKVASAWRQVCQLTWPVFDRWPPDTKRKRCLLLQKYWRELRNTFIKEFYRRRKIAGTPGESPPKLKDYDLLTFLIPTIIKDKEAEPCDNVEQRPNKRARTEPAEEPTAGCSCSHHGEEDQKFLLSLVSHMLDVPRASKLALRSEILQLLAKYTPSTNSDTSQH